MVWIMVYGLTAVSVTCGLALALLPARLFVARDKLVPKDSAPPPWRSLNRFGRIVYVLFAGSAATLLVVSFAGLLLEG